MTRSPVVAPRSLLIRRLSQLCLFCYWCLYPLFSPLARCSLFSLSRDTLCPNTSVATAHNVPSSSSPLASLNLRHLSQGPSNHCWCSVDFVEQLLNLSEAAPADVFIAVRAAFRAPLDQCPGTLRMRMCARPPPCWMNHVARYFSAPTPLVVNVCRRAGMHARARAPAPCVDTARGAARLAGAGLPRAARRLCATGAQRAGRSATDGVAARGARAPVDTVAGAGGARCAACSRRG